MLMRINYKHYCNPALYRCVWKTTLRTTSKPVQLYLKVFESVGVSIYIFFNRSSSRVNGKWKFSASWDVLFTKSFLRFLFLQTLQLFPPFVTKPVTVNLQFHIQTGSGCDKIRCVQAYARRLYIHKAALSYRSASIPSPKRLSGLLCSRYSHH